MGQGDPACEPSFSPPRRSAWPSSSRPVPAPAPPRPPRRRPPPPPPRPRRSRHPPRPPPAAPQRSTSRDNALGKILVDGAGKTLYVFTPDGTTGKSTCTGDCIDNWPALVSDGAPTLGTGLDAEDFTSFTRDDGGAQVVFYAMPLYYFAGDKAAGDTNGQGLGGKWYVVGCRGKDDQVGSTPRPCVPTTRRHPEGAAASFRCPGPCAGGADAANIAEIRSAQWRSSRVPLARRPAPHRPGRLRDVPRRLDVRRVPHPQGAQPRRDRGAARPVEPREPGDVRRAAAARDRRLRGGVERRARCSRRGWSPRTSC